MNSAMIATEPMSDDIWQTIGWAGYETMGDLRTALLRPAHRRQPHRDRRPRGALPVLGVPRDWSAGVSLDPATGLGEAGGYVGHGVTATNLAGRTLTDLVLERGTALTALPWVGHHSRTWEPEPFRWIGVRGTYAAYKVADRREEGGRSTTSPVAVVADMIARRA